MASEVRVSRLTSWDPRVQSPRIPTQERKRTSVQDVQRDIRRTAHGESRGPPECGARRHHARLCCPQKPAGARTPLRRPFSGRQVQAQQTQAADTRCSGTRLRKACQHFQQGATPARHEANRPEPRGSGAPSASSEASRALRQWLLGALRPRGAARVGRGSCYRMRLLDLLTDSREEKKHATCRQGSIRRVREGAQSDTAVFTGQHDTGVAAACHHELRRHEAEA